MPSLAYYPHTEHQWKSELWVRTAVGQIPTLGKRQSPSFLSLLELLPSLLLQPILPRCPCSSRTLERPGKKRQILGECLRCSALLWTGIGFFWLKQSFQINCLSWQALWSVKRPLTWLSPSPHSLDISPWWLPNQGDWLAPCGLPLGLWFLETHSYSGLPCWDLTANPGAKIQLRSPDQFLVSAHILFPGNTHL